MAGRGSRLRPHTLTTAKPLLPVAGKPIVQRLVEDIAAIVGDDLSRIAYVVGEFGQDVENMLLAVAEGQGAKGSIHYQDKPLGTAHAVLCAAEHLEGPVVVAFADTLFRADFKLDAQRRRRDLGQPRRRSARLWRCAARRRRPHHRFYREAAGVRQRLGY